MVHLQEIYEKYKSKGLVVLGYNCADDGKIARKLIREKGVSFPNVLDTSDVAVRTASRGYRMTGVPLNYLIDRNGRVAETWYGYRKGSQQHVRQIERLLATDAPPRVEPDPAPPAADAGPGPWRVTLDLNMPTLDPPAVILALFDSDPLPRMERRMRAGAQSHKRLLDTQTSEKGKATFRRMFVEIHWDDMFQAVTGDRVHLLTTPSARRRAHSLGLSSNSPGRKRWVVTRMLNSDGKSICWYIPLDLEKSNQIKLTLNAGNVFDIDSLYKKITR